MQPRPSEQPSCAGGPAVRSVGSAIGQSIVIPGERPGSRTFFCPSSYNRRRDLRLPAPRRDAEIVQRRASAAACPSIPLFYLLGKGNSPAMGTGKDLLAGATPGRTSRIGVAG